MNTIEHFFEKILWNSRLFILLAVTFGMIGAVILFIVGSVDIYTVAADTISSYIHHDHPAGFHETIVASIIGAVDLYLIAVVLLLFSFGLYELFISAIDAAQSSESSNVLEIRNLDQLKETSSPRSSLWCWWSAFSKRHCTPPTTARWKCSILPLLFSPCRLHCISCTRAVTTKLTGLTLTVTEASQ